MMNNRYEPIEERLWRGVDRSGGPDACWPWLGATSKRYGRLVSWDLAAKRQRWHQAHRVAWESHHRARALDFDVLHTCDNPPCCNPAHLWLGTHADNMADKAAKGRAHRLIGEDNPAATVTWAMVKSIRSDPRPTRELARATGIPRSTLGQIRRFESWDDRGRPPMPLYPGSA
jgi:hypothetical protein